MNNQPLNQPFITQFTKDMKVENATFLIKEAIGLHTTTKKPYIRFTLQDQSGTIDAQLWDTDHSLLNHYPVGSIMLIVFSSVDMYQEKLSLTLDKIEPLAQNDERNNLDYYLPTAPFSPEEMESEIIGFREYIKSLNPLVSDLVEQTFIIQQEMTPNHFYTHPASKENHYSVLGGLAWHTLSMLYSANALTQIYAFKQEIVFGSIMLQNLGKTMSYDNLINMSPTIEGDLFGETAIVDEWLTKAQQRLNIPTDHEDYLNLRHCILSLNKVVQPQTKEAVFVQSIQQLDKSMNVLEKELQNVPIGSKTQPVFMFKNRKFIHL